jgi:ribose 5-phosphate isomerase B
MKIYFAADHAGFDLKNVLMGYVRDELGFEVHDCGALEANESDDYVDFVKTAAEAISLNPTNARGIILGGSGQGEAMCANRFAHVRAGVFYGDRGTQVDSSGASLSMVMSLRLHNDANVLSLAARFLTREEAKDAVRVFLTTSFTEEERHVRRIKKLA